MFVGADAQVQVRAAGGSWQTLYLHLAYINGGPVVAGGAGTIWKNTSVKEASSIEFSSLSGYAQYSAPTTYYIEEWIPYVGPSDYTHHSPGGLHVLYAEDDFIAFAQVSASAGIFLELKPNPGTTVPERVEVRIVVGGETVFHAAVDRFDGTAAKAILLNGVIKTEPGYPNVALRQVPLVPIDGYELD